MYHAVGSLNLQWTGRSGKAVLMSLVGERLSQFCPLMVLFCQSVAEHQMLQLPAFVMDKFCKDAEDVTCLDFDSCWERWSLETGLWSVN